MKEALELHIKNDYFIKVECVDKNEINVRIPKNLDLELPASITNYKLTNDKIKIVRNGREYFVECPVYSIRPLLIADILVDVDRYAISSDLIVFYKENNRVEPENGLMDFVSVFDDSDTQIKSKEEAMTYVIAQILTGELDVQDYATQMDIEEGVKSLFRLLEGD